MYYASQGIQHRTSSLLDCQFIQPVAGQFHLDLASRATCVAHP